VDNVGKIYAVDLCGAASACLALPLLLKVCDGISATILLAGLGAAAAVVFALDTSKKLVTLSLITSILFCGLALLNLPTRFMRINWAVGREEPHVRFETWNSYSRVVLLDETNDWPDFWSASSVTPPFIGRQFPIEIDSEAGTAMPFFDGILHRVEFLKFDLVNVGHYLRTNSNVLVMGVGGGRDILTALLFGARKVTAVEVNEGIVHLLTRDYAKFNRVTLDPRVQLINEDARTFLIRTKEKYDFIHLSLVDTGAATASGALLFTENSIYTVEAWKLCIEELTDTGIFSVSYWYTQEPPVLFHRMVYMAAAALRAANIQDPRKHLIILTNTYHGMEVGTILICRSPFSKDDLTKIRNVARDLKYDIDVDPETAKASSKAQMLAQLNPKLEPTGSYLRFEPPTDECPFVFAVGWFPWDRIFTSVEGIPLAVAFLFTLVGIVLPLAVTKRGFSFFSALPFISYFGAIGLGFIFFEMSQMQRLSIFLGHPTLSLTVVLGTLLFASGCGSFFIQTPMLAYLTRRPILVLTATVAGLALYLAATPGVIHVFSASTVTIKVLVAIAMISPIAVLMGMSLPLGMVRAVSQDSEMTPWLWGINGAASVLGSVTAVLLAMNFSITLVCQVAVLCYAVALASAFLFDE
jgi:predicted membrane-bound spermidine synthase